MNKMCKLYSTTEIVMHVDKVLVFIFSFFFFSGVDRTHPDLAGNYVS